MVKGVFIEGSGQCPPRVALRTAGTTAAAPTAATSAITPPAANGRSKLPTPTARAVRALPTTVARTATPSAPPSSWNVPTIADRSPDSAGAASASEQVNAVTNVAPMPDAASVSPVTMPAGVGRVTLYGHFPTRAALVDAVFAKVNEESAAVLAEVDTSGEPVAALTRLVTETWRIVHQFRSVLQAAQSELPAERIREHHDAHFRRLDALLRRGQRAGAFRRDLPRGWLLAVYYNTVHAAADECAAGRLAEDEAAGVIARTLVAAFTPPGPAVP